MALRRALALLTATVVAVLSARSSSSQSAPVIATLDRYLHGDFAPIAAELSATRDFDNLLKALRQSGPAWIDAGAPADRARRRLAAATFALEAARASDDADWKWVQKIRLDQVYQPPDSLAWKAPPLILEWGCALLRADPQASANERIWQLAALSVAEHRGDFEFLVGSPWEERGNPADEIEHLKHISTRFPNESRLPLAQAIAMEWHAWPFLRGTASSPVTQLTEAYERLRKDSNVGPEATLRLGVVRSLSGQPDAAISLLSDVEEMTRDPYLIYLARYATGQARERQRRTVDAERAYRAALTAVPRANSATVALASLLMKSGRAAEAGTLVESSLAAAPPVQDPWRDYFRADDRFWPRLITALHAEITK
jgi:tetratricopeptide (TPR) repeat protein